MRPTLLPGTHVLTRSASEVQIGLDPRTALVLPDVGPVRDSLRLLAGSAEAGEYADPGLLDLLEEHRLLVDQATLATTVTTGEDPALGPHAGAALVRATGRPAGAARATRSIRAVELRSFGHPAGRLLVSELQRQLDAAGIGGAGTASRSPVGCVVLAGLGEPDRECVDDLTRGGTPHLLLRMVEGSAVVGPFVAPGRTACLRCVDAHRTDSDPAWPLLVRQYAAATRQDRADGAPEPLDPLLASLAASWAARDVVTYVDGGRPSSWSTTVELDEQLHRVTTRSWLRHPDCGCSWT